MKFFKLSALPCAVCISAVVTVCPAAARTVAGAAGASVRQTITIDGKTTDKEKKWRGFGYSCTDASASLLLDYRSEHPDIYRNILKIMFDQSGTVKMTRMAVPVGDDITLAAAKRSADDPADITRGGSFEIAADAREVYPELSLTLVMGDMPVYIAQAEEAQRYELAYEYLTETLTAAYDTYGLTFDCISAGSDEDMQWVSYCADRLKSDTSVPFGADIKNVYSADGFKSIDPYYIERPLTAFYGTHDEKGILTADSPWTGSISAGELFALCEHLSTFSDDGWDIVKSGCTENAVSGNIIFSDSESGTLALADPASGDYTAVFANPTESTEIYTVDVISLARADAEVSVWETYPNEDGTDIVYLHNTLDVTPEAAENGYSYQLTVKPHSLVTVTTLDDVPEEVTDESEVTRLVLPYTDDFEYANMPEGYISEKGGAARFFCDLKGVFEAVSDEDGGCICQVSDGDSVTLAGDDCWSNYTVSADILLAPDDRTSANYAGAGLRYSAEGGYSMMIDAEGSWKLVSDLKILDSGRIKDFRCDERHNISITSEGVKLFGAVDGRRLAESTLDSNMHVSGRAALTGGRSGTRFDNVNVIPVDEMTNYTSRIDVSGSEITFSKNWVHHPCDPFDISSGSYSENIADGSSKPASFSFEFEGDSLSLVGMAENAAVTVIIDGKTVPVKKVLDGQNKDTALWSKYNLGYASHKVSVTVNSGVLKLYGVEYGSMTCLKNGDPSGGMLTEDVDTGTFIGSTGWTGKLSRRRRLLACVFGAAALFAAVCIFYRKRKDSE